MPGTRLKHSAPELLALARERAAIDIVDTDIEEALGHFVNSLNRDARLSAAGAEQMEERLLRVLVNRLRMERDFRNHPEIEEQEIVKPMFLTGTGRTGSTKLHKVLAATGDFKFTPFWQVHNLALVTGDRNENPGARISDAEAYIDWVDRTSPDCRKIHSYGTFEPEEESLIFEFCRFQPPIVIFVDIPSYLEWYATQDFTFQLQFLKRSLQYLQWQFHDGDTRPWLLKCPIYPGFEDQLMSVFPDASMVSTYRDPVKTLPSMASLWCAFISLYSDSFDPAAIGPGMVEGQAAAMNRHVAIRDSHPEYPFIDVSYAKLTNDAAGVLQDIYRQAGIPDNPRSREIVARWEAEHAQHKHGAHRYSLQDYGLSEDLIRDKCANFIERYEAFL